MAAAICVAMTGAAQAEVIAHWTFDEFEDGTVAGPLVRIRDYSNNQRDGWSLGDTAMVRVTNPYGTSTAMSLGPTADGLIFRAPWSSLVFGSPAITAEQAINWNGSWTVEIVLATTQSGERGTLMHYNAGDPDDAEWWVRMNDNGTVTFLVQDTAGTTTSVVSTIAINDGAWRHVAAIYDAVNQQIELFIDGQSQGTASTATFNGELLTDHIDYLRVGSWLNANQIQLTALVDQVRISDEALSPGQFIAPEPASVVLLAVGGLTLLRRRDDSARPPI